MKQYFQRFYQHTLGKIITIVVISALVLVGCNETQKNSEIGQATDKKEIVIGVTVGVNGQMVRDVVGPLLEKQGYSYKLIEFADYIRPNLALADGDLDINIFQHKPYLDAFKAQHNLAIEEVFQIPTAPYGLYAGKTKRLEDAHQGMKVSAPNDPSNYARVLVILDHLGWIKLKENTNYLTASREDIAENPLNIEIITLDAGQLPRSLQDVDFSAINGNFAISAGLDPKNAIFTEPTFTFVNWSAARIEDRDAPWLKAITEAFNSDELKAYTAEHFEGYQLPEAWAQDNR
ncbi:hypothetical protein DC083_07445 [Ignatzschineria ureiclastica]|uniref:Lipoprotein n=1 Tax=Ignatzschineria ureiclastica TaxID=472582 RepID=A0A2U2AEE8_9GAMM|nr:MetQ/NlpA family ABC transporter substrate-binding protein [Ignatzschineria ureiclastica]PWD80929.1 hypothetical protein DC083_07445 [Ignatzschineria ureiclastica]GGZ93814.1 lipoprotein [Ignatzschineria ureiclastica]